MPNIFDLLNHYAYLRGLTAVYLVVALALFVLLIWDWRLALLALMGQYLIGGFLFVDVLDPRLAIIKVLVGLFACLMFYMTGRQINWGRLPVDILPSEIEAWQVEKQRPLGPFMVPSNLPLRAFLITVALGILWRVSHDPAYQLPGLAGPLAHLNIAVYALLGIGFLGMALTTHPLKAGMGLLTFLMGFELFYSVLEQSVAMLTLFAVVNLALSLAVAYLSQTRYAIQTILE